MPGKTLTRREFLALAGVAGAAVACPALTLPPKSPPEIRKYDCVMATDLWSGRRGKLLYSCMDGGGLIVGFRPLESAPGGQRYSGDFYMMEAVGFERQVILSHENFRPFARPGDILFYGPNYEVAVFMLDGKIPIGPYERALPCRGPSYDKGGFSWEKCTRAMRDPV